jgi:alpha-L-rhamnosidase
MKKYLLFLWILIAMTQQIRAITPSPTGLICQLLSHPEFSAITAQKPQFGWIVNSSETGDFQVAYQVMAASTVELLAAGNPDMWNSGKVMSDRSINVRYAGKPLSSDSVYYWKVRTYCKKGGESGWSDVQRFNTSGYSVKRDWPGESRWVQIRDGKGGRMWAMENRHPVIYHPVLPVRARYRNPGVWFYDFGRSAFSTVQLNLTWIPKDTLQEEMIFNVNIGEKGVGDSIDQQPGGGIIFRTYPLVVERGMADYVLEIPRFVPKYPHSQVMPEQMPEVAPFRYCEILTGQEKVNVNKITQRALYVLYNEKASQFTCSDSLLNAVYNLCKYSTIANTFNGDYANSERERMMYEADCYIQQMCHYAIDREFAIARYSLENLIYHATWPTEWIFHSVMMAWADYLYTGNTDVIRNYYDDLKAKTMTALETDKGLVSTRTGLQTREFLNSIHFNGKELRDIVDWPNSPPMGKDPGGETDGFDFRDYNTVVNAFYYRSLVLMSKMAVAAGRDDDAKFFKQKADALKEVFNMSFFNATRGVYVDGMGSEHASLHANMYPLCFGLVPDSNKQSVIDFIKSKGMACGVYGSNYLLETLFDNDQADYALGLLTSHSDRSWFNMLRLGATMTTEAWDNKYKSNNGWSHAWSASPAHILPRKIMGIEPAEPGFGKINIRPHPGNLTFSKAIVPTIRGEFKAGFTQVPGKSFTLDISIPVNTTATVYLPVSSGKCSLFVDGKERKCSPVHGTVKVDDVLSGTHLFKVEVE